MNTIVITDLTNAGRRGKKCEEVRVGVLGHRSTADDQVYLEIVAKALDRADTMPEALVALDRVLEQHSDALSLERDFLRGVDVLPVDKQTIEISTPAISLTVSFTDFRLANRLDLDNGEMAMVARGKKNLPLFYVWCRDNESHIKSMNFLEVVRQAESFGLELHRWSSIG